MAFQISSLPAPVRTEFLKAQSAPILWPAVLHEAVKAGMKDANKLTDIVFYLHHPERIGNPLGSGETKLINEWKAFRTMIKPAIPEWAKPAKPAEPEEPSLADLLRDVDTDALGKTEQHRAHLSRLKSLFLRALGGEDIDTTYWQFTYFDGFGRERNGTEKHSVMSVKRHARKQNALGNFKRCAEYATTSSEVGKCLKMTEYAVATHTFVVVRWAHQNTATGDGSLKPYTEYGYLKELAALSKQRVPETIYSCYKDELVMTLGNVG